MLLRENKIENKGIAQIKKPPFKVALLNKSRIIICNIKSAGTLNSDFIFVFYYI